MRSDMRWLLLLTAIIGIVGCADALKATSLIFGRVPNSNKTTASTTTTTTTTSTTVATNDGDQQIDEEKKDDDEATDEESTKPPLTGIPQIDYIWDPNLPRELNGYNLSTYPFLNSVPDNEDIDFKCDGLHDGFYASIKYSCQLYHHCVYGIRHDFLCANFTAFDQKSFICHFVSEVNCKASAKYWFRNDALYKATTTTSTTTTTVAPPPTTSQAPERPRRPEGRRPLRRRRPQHEYYYDDEDYDDDYVEERMNRRRKTNRNRNRRPSDYDDDYESPPRANYKDDEDDYSYEQRSSYRHRNRNRDSDDDFEYDRRSYRNRKRPTENKRHHDDDRRMEETEERRPHSDSRKYQHDTSAEGGKRKFNDRRTSLTDDRKAHNDDKSSYDDRRSLGEDDRTHSDDRRTMHEDRRKVNDDRRPTDDDRRSSMDEGRRNIHDKRRPTSDRRPLYEDDYDDVPKKPGNRDEDDYDDRPYKRPAHDNKPEIVPKVRSSSATSSIFNRPRAPPKINRPVPNNEKKKYEYVPQKAEKSTTAAPATDDELYDEYDYEGEKMAQIDIKHEPADNKKSYPATSSQRDQRPAPPRVELKQEKLPSTFNTDDLEDEDFDIKDKVTSIKPQRSTSPKVEPPPPPPPQQHQQQQQQQQRPAKLEYYEKPKEAVVKSNARPTLDFNKDEYIPDSDLVDYSDEEIDDRLTKEEEVRQPETIPTRTEFRQTVPVQEHQIKVPEPIAIPKPIKDHETILPKIPYAPPQPQQDLQFKTKFHRLSPSNIRTADDSFQKPNTEPEERDVYTILPKDTISPIREPSGFKPVSYNEQPHDLDTDTNTKNRPFVRIMKRPFLPSRGGSPYLPRGLKPVGAGITTSEYTTEHSHGGSKLAATAIGNVQLFGHQLPIQRTNPNNAYVQPQSQLSMQMHAPSIPIEMRTTTQHPQIESPRSPLDEIFNSDYDVTLNDALNPTLKPLSQSHESPIGFSLNKYDRTNPYARSDVSHAPSQYRSTAIPIPIHSRQQAPQTPIQQQQQQHQQQQHQTPPPPPPPQPQQHQQQQRQPQQSQQSQYYDDEYEY